MHLDVPLGAVRSVFGRDNQVRDNDPLYRRLGSVLARHGVKSRPIMPGSPWMNCYAERLIGSIRRECTDHMIVLGEGYLRRLLEEYRAYYNEVRPHGNVGCNSPVPRRREEVGELRSVPVLGGLHHRYQRAA